MNRILNISPKIQKALTAAQPIVALQSTIITHGMPYPSNLNTALQVEAIIEREGAVPATIAILEGKPIVGLSKDELEWLAQQDRNTVQKCSRRDLAAVAAQKKCGSTTVAATMILARLAGISIFATGGIGGVHRGGEISMDISADLYELGRTPVTVVCAGAKSILDIGRTLQVLQTQGVPVVGYQTQEFPAFFSKQSGYKCSTSVQSPEQAALLVQAQKQLELQSGILIGVPNPSPAGQEIEQLIQTALRLCEEQKISGNEVTPFILSYLHQKSEGKSLEANIALIKRNAEVAAQIAVALHNLKQVGDNHSSHTFKFQTQQSEISPTPLSEKNISQIPASSKVVVIGGAAIDFNCKSYVPLQLHTSNPGTASRSFGGVGRNIAEVLARLGSQTQLLTAVGKDALGAQLLRFCAQECNIDISRCATVKNVETASYVSALDVTGEMKLAIAAMDILKHIDDQFVLNQQQSIHSSKVVVADANITSGALRQIAKLCKMYSKPLFFEPVSVQKSKIALESQSIAEIDFIAPNQYELEKMVGLNGTLSFNQKEMKNALGQYYNLLKSFGYKRQLKKPQDSWKFGKYRYVLAKFGKEGVYLCRVSEEEGAQILAKKEGLRGVDIKNENGAGDTLLGSMVHAYCSGVDPVPALQLAFESVRYCLEAQSTIPSHFPISFLQRFKEC